MDDLVGVVLAAGHGTRISPLNINVPKPLLEIGNRSIIEYHHDIFLQNNISKSIIVTGKNIGQFKEYFSEIENNSLDIKYINQNEPMGIAHAVSKAEPYINGPFILSLGDIFFHSASFGSLIQRYKEGDVSAVIAVKEEQNPLMVSKNFSVELDNSGYVSRVVEKPKYPRSLLKGCGIYLFGPEVFEAIRKTPRTPLRNEYELTTSVQILIDDGHKIAVDNCIDWDVNITYPIDLLNTNLDYLNQLGFENLISGSAIVDPSASLSGCIIGANSRIIGPAKLVDCLVLRNSSVNTREELKRCIIAKKVLDFSR